VFPPRTPPADLEAFLRHEHGRLVAAVDLIVDDPAAAEDIVQEAMIRAAARWGRVRDLASPGGWLHRVAVNLAISHVRRRGTARRALERIAVREPARVQEDPDPSVRVAVRDALQTLPPDERAVLVLRYLLDASLQETADALGRSPTATRSLTQRARTRLRQLGGDALRALHIDDEETTDVR
jgi:RNA polymerase sigma factor (sigma-70 family)